MLSEQKMSVKLLMIGAVLLIAAVKGESLAEPSIQLCNRNFVFFSFLFTTFYYSVTQCPKDFYVAQPFQSSEKP